MPVIGIDLGTTYSCVAVVQHGQVEIIANEQGSRTTPSCVSFTESEVLVGESGKHLMSINPETTIYDAKRMIGLSFGDPALQSDMSRWPFEVCEEDERPKIRVKRGNQHQHQQFFPEEISSMVLAKMKNIAEAYLGEKVDGAVITVPARFNNAQRGATKDAATIAELNLLGIINEPTAAAIAYGLQEKCTEARNVLIFDFGGGTFDVTVLVVQDRTINVKATGGDPHLGGQDVDDRMLRHFVAEFKKKHGMDIGRDSKATSRLRQECESAKRTLSTSTQASLHVPSLSRGIDFDGYLTRALFDQLNDDLFTGTLETVEATLEDACLDRSEIDEVVLVGGSTRILKIQSLLEEYFGEDKICKTINPDEAVAYGAAVKATLLSDGASSELTNVVLHDVTPLSLGIETKGKIMSFVVKRNTRIPSCTWGYNYTTVYDNQSVINISVFEGERSSATENQLLGNFKLHGILPAPAGVPKIDVCFDIDEDGVLTVSARDKNTKGKGSITISQDSHRLSSEKIQQIISNAKRFKIEDREWKERTQALNDLEAFIYNVQRSLRKDAVQSTVGESELREIKDKCNELTEWATENRDDVAEMSNIMMKKAELESVCHPVFSRMYQDGQKYQPSSADNLKKI